MSQSIPRLDCQDAYTHENPSILPVESHRTHTPTAVTIHSVIQNVDNTLGAVDSLVSPIQKSSYPPVPYPQVASSSAPPQIFTSCSDQPAQHPPMALQIGVPYDHHEGFEMQDIINTPNVSRMPLCSTLSTAETPSFLTKTSPDMSHCSTELSDLIIATAQAPTSSQSCLSRSPPSIESDKSMQEDELDLSIHTQTRLPADKRFNPEMPAVSEGHQDIIQSAVLSQPHDSAQIAERIVSPDIDETMDLLEVYTVAIPNDDKSIHSEDHQSSIQPKPDIGVQQGAEDSPELSTVSQHSQMELDNPQAIIQSCTAIQPQDADLNDTMEPYQKYATPSFYGDKNSTVADYSPSDNPLSADVGVERFLDKIPPPFPATSCSLADLSVNTEMTTDDGQKMIQSTTTSQPTADLSVSAMPLPPHIDLDETVDACPLPNPLGQKALILCNNSHVQPNNQQVASEMVSCVFAQPYPSVDISADSEAIIVLSPDTAGNVDISTSLIASDLAESIEPMGKHAIPVCDTETSPSDLHCDIQLSATANACDPVDDAGAIGYISSGTPDSPQATTQSTTVVQSQYAAGRADISVSPLLLAPHLDTTTERPESVDDIPLEEENPTDSADLLSSVRPLVQDDNRTLANEETTSSDLADPISTSSLRFSTYSKQPDTNKTNCPDYQALLCEGNQPSSMPDGRTTIAAFNAQKTFGDEHASFEEPDRLSNEENDNDSLVFSQTLPNSSPPPSSPLPCFSSPPLKDSDITPPSSPMPWKLDEDTILDGVDISAPLIGPLDETELEKSIDRNVDSGISVLSQAPPHDMDQSPKHRLHGKSGEQTETVPRGSSQLILSPSKPPLPIRQTLASQRKQYKKLATPFRSPLITSGVISVTRKLDVYATHQNNRSQSSGSSQSKAIYQESMKEKEKIDISPPTTSSTDTKDFTHNAAKQFKSPLSSSASGKSFSVSIMTATVSSNKNNNANAPTIQSLQARVQKLKQALKIKKDASDEENLGNLANKWTCIAREVANEVWSSIKDLDPGEAKTSNASRNFGDRDDLFSGNRPSLGAKRPFDSSWGYNETQKRQKSGNFEEPWGWDVEEESTSKVEDGEEAQVNDNMDVDTDDAPVFEHSLGTMLRYMGIAPETLGWDEDEGDFVELA
ncbi:hypothetical protein ABKN59_000255 [Abortiporus biennis]